MGFAAGIVGQNYGNKSRVTINVPGPYYLNLGRVFWSLNPSITTIDANGYPVGVLPGTKYSNPSMPAGYFGDFLVKWQGNAGLLFNGSPPLIISSGSQYWFNGITDAAAGSNQFLTGTTTTSGATNARTTFRFGFNIQSITQGANGVITINTKTNYVGSHNNGATILIAGAAANTGANGTWTIANPTASSFDLVGSTYTNGQATPAGTATLVGLNMSIGLQGGVNFQNFTNFVWCRVADEKAIDAGQLVDPSVVSMLIDLFNQNIQRDDSRGWLRFMDINAVQGNWETVFTSRVPTTALSYNGWWAPGFWAGAIANSGDALACSNPPYDASGTGAYPDLYTVQGVINTTNTTAFPTLSVGGRAAKPIIPYGTSPLSCDFSGPASAAGQVLQFTYQGAVLAGLPGVTGSGASSTYIYNYTTIGTVNVTGAVNNGSGFVRLTVDSTVGFISGQSYTIAGVGGTTEANGQPTVTVVDATHLDLPYVPFVHTFASNGTITGYYGDDTQLDSNSNYRLCANISLAMNKDPVLSAAPISMGNSGKTISFCYPTPQAGQTIITYTSGPALCTLYAIKPGSLSSTAAVSFFYSYLLDAWIYRWGDNAYSCPLEYVVELCNKVGANCWWNFGFHTGSFITQETQYFAQNLNHKFAWEPWNEVWNFGAFPYPTLCNQMAPTLGWTNSQQGGYDLVGLRTIQYDALAKAAWTGAGRAASDYMVLTPSATFEGKTGLFDMHQSQGIGLLMSNKYYANYGALGGGPMTVSHNTPGSRPIDISNTLGMAPYWGSSFMGGTAAGIGGTVAMNASWLQVALDFANGLQAQAFAELVSQFNGTVRRSDGGVGGTLYGTYASEFTNNTEAMCAQFDAYRKAAGLPKLIVMHYEGGPQWSPAANLNNGINSVNSVDIAALAARMTALGWDVSAYTQSGTNNTTEMATMVITALQAWKFDVSYKNFIKTYYYQALKNANPLREAHGAQYGISGSEWGIFPGDFRGGNPYAAYYAIKEWNAGN